MKKTKITLWIVSFSSLLAFQVLAQKVDKEDSQAIEIQAKSIEVKQAELKSLQSQQQVYQSQFQTLQILNNNLTTQVNDKQKEVSSETLKLEQLKESLKAKYKADKAATYNSDKGEFEKK